MKETKYAKFSDSIDHRVKVFRWPFWLLPLLFLCLILVLGLFIFITLHSTGRFCLFHCEQQKIDDGGLIAPSLEDSEAGNPDRHGMNPLHKRKDNKTVSELINIKGKITLPKSNMLTTVPTNSQLRVDFEDTSIADASTVKICHTIVGLSSYKKSVPIEYSIECERPKHPHFSYSVSAVFNIGWSPVKGNNEWLRKGDYFTDTVYNVDLTKEGTVKTLGESINNPVNFEEFSVFENLLAFKLCMEDEAPQANIPHDEVKPFKSCFGYQWCTEYNSGSYLNWIVYNTSIFQK
ncbi:predicted protein [Nematostella vectensis]|uniref:Uncharacterized protein n=1 Tax=Nematostella vectensis TaxID=45351 RepID=A7ST00_NEMVE|nr:predicted protein [Nematostella vectensis]|eukprot:XP_001625269.1 predicted protein [Nematostella vectensis]